MAAKELARREKKSAGAVISDLARKGLNGVPAAAGDPDADAASFYGFHPWPRRGKPVTNELINRLRDDGPY